jgi:hypothetical protein
LLHELLPHAVVVGVRSASQGRGVLLGRADEVIE